MSSKGRLFTCDGCGIELETEQEGLVPTGWQHLEIMTTPHPSGSLSRKARWWRSRPRHADVCSAKCAGAVASGVFETARLAGGGRAT